jgi:hypothetical protein
MIPALRTPATLHGELPSAELWGGPPPPAHVA